MPDTTLVLLRHGQTRWNVEHRFQGRQDSELTALGQRQAADAARALRHLAPSHIVSSDLGRAQATAAILGQALGLEPTFDPLWRERDFGDLEGQSIHEVDTRFGPDPRRRLGLETDYSEHRIESLAALDARIRSALQSVATSRPGQTTLVVTHGGPILAAARIALGTPHSAPRGLSIENCSINVFKFHEGRWRVETWGAPPPPAPEKPRATILYCRQCNWMLRAAWLAQELLTTFSEEIGEVSLLPGTGGAMEIRLDGELIFSRKQAGRFPEAKELKQLVRDRIAPGRHLGHSDQKSV